MSLADDLGGLAAAGGESDYQRIGRDRAPAGWEAGVKYDGSDRLIVTTPPMPELGDESTWAAAIAALGVHVPDGYRVRLVEAKYDPAAWHRDAQGEDAVTRAVWRYRFVVDAVAAAVGIDDLLAAVAKWKPRKRPEASGEGLAYVVAYSDTQIGKPDGDGTAGTVNRVLTKTDAAVQQLRDLRKVGHVVDSVYLPQLGDCIEGFNSQGGRLAWRNELTLTEQVRVYRRLLLYVVQSFAPLADRVVVPVVPGNHDEAVRTGDKMSTRYDDSWAIDAASAVADVVAATGAADHVSFVFPARDELTVTLDMAGTTVGLAHGHQTRGKTHDWWAKQAHGMQAIGDATLLLTGHYHHLKVEQMGAKTWLQAPSLDGGSTWYRHLTGQDAPPGLTTMLVGNGGWGHLVIV